MRQNIQYFGFYIGTGDKYMKKDNWIPTIFILTFILSFIFAAISTLASNMNVLLLGILLITIIFIGIIFDMIGVTMLLVIYVVLFQEVYQHL